MNAARPPVITGVAGGVGTSVLAAALHGVDDGAFRPERPAHVLVCRSVMSSVGAAHDVLARMPARPVLAVVADIPHAQYPAGVGARLRMIEPYVAAQVYFPYVPGWREIDDPIARAAGLLLAPPARGPEREYMRALDMTIAALAPLLLAGPHSSTPSPAPRGPAAGALPPPGLGTGDRLHVPAGDQLFSSLDLRSS